MRPILLATTIATAFVATAASADEGMWTFDNFPSAKVQKAYGFAPDRKWLDTVRLSAVRLTGGCSGSVVSSAGLVLTNHHCVVDCAQNLSSTASDYVANGYLADLRKDEGKCPGQQAEIVTAISDVTPRVQAAIGTATGLAFTKARDAAVAAIESEGCPDKALFRCQVVTLYGGGQYKLYRYRKYSDVRLVFAPEYASAQFGGDPDNFNFPRYGLDASFLRLYENGKPLVTPAHLKWAARAPVPGELVFVAGNPGSTQRLFTQSQLAFRRDTQLPITLLYLSELRGRLIGAMAGDAEKTRTGADTLFSIENSFKANYGMQRSLLDPAFSAKLAAGERDLRARAAGNAAVGDPWTSVDTAIAAYREIYLPYVWLESRAGATGDLYHWARTIVRAAQERTKPNGERLPEYSESRLPLLEKTLVDPKPTYPWLEEAVTAFWLSKTREYLTADDPTVKVLLGRDSPEALAKRLIGGTTLADPAARKALFDGGLAAVQASSDPLIKFVLATDAQARAVRERYDAEVDGPITAAQAKLAQARFAAYGDTLYPDATFTLRLSYGQVQGWSYGGRTIAPTTNFAGLYDRATGQDPYELPAKWLAAKGKLDPNTVLDFSTTNDVVGGNSGSPVIARDMSVVGALFDGNIHSLGGSFGYDPALNRSVVVSTGAVQEALAKVYGANVLLKELAAR